MRDGLSEGMDPQELRQRCFIECRVESWRLVSQIRWSKVHHSLESRIFAQGRRASWSRPSIPVVPVISSCANVDGSRRKGRRRGRAYPEARPAPLLAFDVVDSHVPSDSRTPCLAAQGCLSDADCIPRVFVGDGSNCAWPMLSE